MNEHDNRPGESEGGEETFDFERALERIETIVHTLEEGRGGLDESLSLYEEGVKLLRRCHGLLRAAEQRIELLAGWDEAGEEITTAFDARETFAAPSSSSSSSSSSAPHTSPPAASAFRGEPLSGGAEGGGFPELRVPGNQEGGPAGDADPSAALSKRHRSARRSDRS